MRRKKATDIVITQSSKAYDTTDTTEVRLLFYEKYKDNVTFEYKETSGSKVYVTVSDDQLSCMRIGDSNTFCRFVMHEKTQLIKDTEIDTHLFETYTKNIIQDDDKIMIQYDLMIDGDIIDTISMTWEIS